MYSYTKVAGCVAVPERQEILAKLAEEQEAITEDLRKQYGNNVPDLEFNRLVHLVRESDNPYDENAISVWVSFEGLREQIGYVPAKIKNGEKLVTATELAPLIDSGAMFKAEITHITGGGNKHYGANLRIIQTFGSRQ